MCIVISLGIVSAYINYILLKFLEIKKPSNELNVLKRPFLQ